MVKMNNEGGGIVTMWSYSLFSVENKYPLEEKELLARYWNALKELDRGQKIQVITQSPEYPE